MEMEEGKKCGRWNPTGEQVRVLTELFRAGLRTPSTEQIQKISAELSLYGKIESKNVFYWFQNHKARERHKRRRLSANKPLCTKPLSLSAANNNHMCNDSESERPIQTLQLFPLRPFQQYRNAPPPKDTAYAPFPHPPLDLRLSFL